MMSNSKKLINIIVFFVVISQYSVAAISASGELSYSKEGIPKIDPTLLDIRLVDPSLYGILTIDQWAAGNNLEVLTDINKYKNTVAALERKFTNLNAQNGHLKLSGNLLTNVDLATGKEVTLNPSKFRNVVAKSDGTFDVTDGELPNGDVIKGDAAIYTDSIFIKGDGMLTSKNFNVQGTKFQNTLVHLRQDETTVSGNALVEGNNFIGVVGAKSDGKNWFEDTGTITFTPEGPISGLRSAYVLDPYEEAKARVGLMSTYARYQGSGSAPDKGTFPANDELTRGGKQELSRLAYNFLKERLPNQFDEAGNSLYRQGYVLVGGDRDSDAIVSTDIRSSETYTYFRPNPYIRGGDVGINIETNRPGYRNIAFFGVENVIDPLYFKPEAVTGAESVITTPFGEIEQTQKISSKSTDSSVHYSTHVAGGSVSARYSLQKTQSNEKSSNKEFEAGYDFYGNGWELDTSFLSTTTKVKGVTSEAETRNGLVVKYIKYLDRGILEVTADSARRSLEFNYQLVKISNTDGYYREPSKNSESSSVSVLSNRDFEGVILPVAKK